MGVTLLAWFCHTQSPSAHCSSCTFRGIIIIIIFFKSSYNLSHFSNAKIKYKHLNFSRKKKKKKMLIHFFFMTPCSDSFPSTLEMPRLILPNFVFLQLTANKAKAFCMPARLNPSCCIIWRSLFCSKSVRKVEMWIAFQRNRWKRETFRGTRLKEPMPFKSVVWGSSSLPNMVS